ncbi:hypothetical protein ACWEPC_02105, partial [Nonomuraea sp. NPDC004297]
MSRVSHVALVVELAPGDAVRGVGEQARGGFAALREGAASLLPLLLQGDGRHVEQGVLRWPGGLDDVLALDQLGQ